MTLRVSIILALSSGAMIASCSTTPVQEARSPKADRELADALAGRTPGPPVRCLANYRTTHMEVIDDYTILYREGRTIYLQKPRGGCRGLKNGIYTLVTRKYGTNQICDSDINRLIDLRTGMGGGSCMFEPFIPYTKS